MFRIQTTSQGFIGLLSELWLMPVFSGVVISGITIVVVSLLTKPNDEVLKMYELQNDKSLDLIEHKDSREGKIKVKEA